MCGVPAAYFAAPSACGAFLLFDQGFFSRVRGERLRAFPASFFWLPLFASCVPASIVSAPLSVCGFFHVALPVPFGALFFPLRASSPPQPIFAFSPPLLFVSFLPAIAAFPFDASPAPLLYAFVPPVSLRLSVEFLLWQFVSALCVFDARSGWRVR